MGRYYDWDGPDEFCGHCHWERSACTCDDREYCMKCREYEDQCTCVDEQETEETNTKEG